ncbi:glycoside hydrolase family 2 protein [Kribbella sp. NPDC050470]|uniref:glycoside hydrolase family 2 protein n=1 Tax=unclassified Kribbella TaxID=2644121 RepID=UPI0037B11F7B
MSEEYPRPLLKRDHWQDLCGPWDFATGDGSPYMRTIQVPYPPESTLSGIDDQSPHPVVRYRRTVRLDRQPLPGERVLLHAGAVDYRADVWVNDVHVGGHEGGHTPFTLDVTAALAGHDDHVIVVRAEDPLDDGTQPRGKQDWRERPHGVWYHRTTGIWQPVWLEIVPALHVRRLHWTPDVVRGSVTAEVELSYPPAPGARVRIVLSHQDRVLADQTALAQGQRQRWDVAIEAARHQLDQRLLLWSPDQPTLLDARVEVIEGDRVVDSVTSYVGLRSVGVRDGRFLLNGQPMFLRLVLAQNYWPESRLAAPSAAALRREVELIKELGFDGVRVHQKVEDPRFLACCDRLGLVVWDEMPSAYEYAPRTVERLTKEWLEVVERDRSHPCVVTWVPFNESWGVWHATESAQQRHATTALYHLTHALDGTRPVISNDGWEHTESDIWGLHDYAPTAESLRARYADRAAVERVFGDRPPARRTALLGDPVRRGQPLMLTEIGGLSLRPPEGEEWHGYAAVDSVAEFTKTFQDMVDAMLDSPEIAGFCWTQLTDTDQETNGLLTAGREPKLPVEVVRSILGRPARSTPAEAIDAARREARRTAR